MKTTALAGLGLLQVLPSTAEYVWPSKYDYMEELLYLQSGYIRNGFRDGKTQHSNPMAETDNNRCNSVQLLFRWRGPSNSRRMGAHRLP